jgi:hypothetical protein
MGSLNEGRTKAVSILETIRDVGTRACANLSEKINKLRSACESINIEIRTDRNTRTRRDGIPQQFNRALNIF